MPKNKHFPIKPINISPPLPFYENATHFNYRIAIDTKGPISPSSQGNSYFVSLLILLSTLLSLTFLLIFPLNMVFKRYSIIGLQVMGYNHWITRN